MPLEKGTYGIGARVILTDLYAINPVNLSQLSRNISPSPANPVNSCIGTITEICCESIVVKWDNGYENYYERQHLDFARLSTHDLKSTTILPGIGQPQKVDSIRDESWQNPLRALRDVLPDMYGRKDHEKYMALQKASESFKEVTSRYSAFWEIDNIMKSIKRKDQHEDQQDDVPGVRNGCDDSDFARRMFND